MKVFRSLGEAEKEGRPVVLAIGVFDGFHRGHQQVIALAKAKAMACGGVTWLLTFEPHPLTVLQPDTAPPRLVSARTRRHLAAETGLDAYIEHPFTTSFSQMSPASFLDYLIVRLPTLSEIVVGANWRFGHGAAGDVDLLSRMGESYGFGVDAAPPVLHGGHPVSSTRIRNAVLDGDVASAREMLGRPYTVSGPVVHGAKTGRRLGFPTANVLVENEVVPPPGIYAVVSEFDGERHAGAGYRGEGGAAGAQPGPVVEVHLLDCQPELYGKRLAVSFVDRVRDDTRFESPEDLVHQIGKDVETIRSLLATTRSI